MSIKVSPGMQKLLNRGRGMKDGRVTKLAETMDGKFDKLEANGISIRKAADGTFEVRFPYEMLDQFKPNFPSAKWNRYDKVWIVGPRGGKRLQAWFELVKEEAEAIQKGNQALEEADLTKEEKLEIKAALTEKLKSIDAMIKEIAEKEEDKMSVLEEKLEQLEGVLSELKADEEKLNRAAEKKREMEEKISSTKKEIDAFLDRILDRKEIEAAIEEMDANHRKVGSVARDKFLEAKEVIGKYRDLLAEAGYRLEALDYLYYAKFNRPDRDSVHNMPKDAWYNLEKIEDDE